MAPIRRYLRITKHSVLEVRIYLHKPSDASWLLSTRDNVLHRVIEEVRPKVLPKLREENENARNRKGGSGKAKKKKGGIKDVASQEDFEVAIFLKETSTRHSLLMKQKVFGQGKERLKSTGNKMTGVNDAQNPIVVREDAPAVRQEEDEEDDVQELYKIPEAGSGKRKAADDGQEKDGEGEEDEDGLFVSSSDEEFFTTQRAKPPTKKRRKGNTSAADLEEEDVPAVLPEEEQDDKKKLMMDTTYDGFSIYGRILCLIVTRKGKRDKGPTGTGTVGGGSQMMEQWVSTQVAGEAGLDDEEG
jgi:hypothetical protein